MSHHNIDSFRNPIGCRLSAETLTWVVTIKGQTTRDLSRRVRVEPLLMILTCNANPTNALSCKLEAGRQTFRPRRLPQI
jgi:hypothetical protein